MCIRDRTEEEVGRQHQEMDRPEVRQVPEGSGEQEKNGGNWLRNHPWCPSDPRYGTDDDDDDKSTPRHSRIFVAPSIGKNYVRN